MAVDSADNVIVTGAYTGTSSTPGAIEDFGLGTFINKGGGDVFVAKFSPAGDILWSKSFGGLGGDCSDAVAVDRSGNIVLSGHFDGSGLDFGGGPLSSSGGRDMFLAKLTPSGGYLWAKRLGGTGSDTPRAVALDPSGDVILAGSFENIVDFGGGPLSSAGGDDAFLAKYSGLNGSHLWSKRFGDAQAQAPYGVAADGNGNVVITGQFYGTIDMGGGAMIASQFQGGGTFLAKYSSSGTHLWSKGFGLSGLPAGPSALVAIDKDNNIVLAGTAPGPFDLGCGWIMGYASDPFAAKLSADGACLWTKRGDSQLAESGTAFAVDRNGDAFLVGNCGGQQDFGCSVQAYYPPTTTLNNSFLMKFGP